MAEFSNCVASATHNDVHDLLDSFHLAAKNANLKAYFGCFHAKGTFLGTDATENWTIDKFFEYSEPHFKSGKGWTYVPIRESRKTIFFELGTSSTLCTFDEILNSESFGVQARGSGSLIRENSSSLWFISSYHLSFPIPNDIAKGITLKIQAFDKLNSVKKADEAAAELLAELEFEDKEKDKKIPAKGKKSKGKR